MNSPASSERQNWGWDHENQNQNRHCYGGVTMSVGLETRQYQGGNGKVLDYDWGSSPVVLSGGVQHPMSDADRKPQIMSGAGMDSSNMGQYNENGSGSHVNLNVVALNGMFSSGMSHNSIIAGSAQPNNINGNPLSLTSFLCTRGYGGGSGHHLLEGIRSSPFVLGEGHNVLSGYNSSSALEEQRHPFLGMMGMDQKSIFHNIVKHEEFYAGDFQARIGLDLGGRTYFSTEDNIVNRLYKRPRAISPGLQVPRCQAEGCKADLSTAKHYHRRHKVCELHSKAATVVSGGITQRFCQQCSRFHVLSEFDEGKRSCRKRLADHNRRRRKPQPNPSVKAAIAEGGAVSPVKGTEGDQDTNSESNQSNLQPEPISGTEAQVLLTGISLSPSLPLVLHSSKGQQQYMQQPGPNMSRVEMAVEYPRHTSREKYNGLENAIPWLKPANSSSEFGGSEKNSSSNGGQVSESGTTSSSVQVFSSIQNQNLLHNLQSSSEIGTSDWMVNGNLHSSNNARNHHHYGPADLNLQASLEGQQMFSLLEKSVGDGGRQNAVEYASRGGLNSKHAVDVHSEGFSRMQSLRSLGQSMYQNIL